MTTDAWADGRSGLTDGSLLGGRYRLGELLGVGSSAAVFEAVDVTASDSEGPIAVKVLHAHLCQDRAALMSFLGEGKAASTVEHPRVVRVHGWGTHEAGGLSVGWLALDRVDGRNLAEVVSARGRLTPHEAVDVMYGVLDGLAAIHAAGLVHRDLTPRNVLISGADDRALTSSSVHIADLGLADLTGRTALVGDRGVAGTPAYVSPEQVLGQPVAPTADLYQAGALLYFLIVGKPPYVRDSTAKVVDAHLYAPPPVPSAQVREAAPLDRLVIKALSKQPALRHQSAGEFRAALSAAMPAASAPAIAPRAIDATAVLSAATTPATYLPVDAATPAAGTYRKARSDSRLGIVAALVIAVLVLVPVVQTVLPGSASASITVARSASATSVATGVVPLLTGTLQDAQAALLAQGFVTGQVTTQNSSELEGQLIAQTPAPGSLSPRGSAVDLVVASGRNAVPRLAGLTVAAASAQLKAAGFVAAGQLGPGGLVGATSPAGGQVVRVGSTVTLVAPAVPPASPTPTPSEPTASSSEVTPSPTPSPSRIPSSSTPTTRTSSTSASGGA